MLVMRSDKYCIPQVRNNLIHAKTIDGNVSFFVETAKFVDVKENMVFIYDNEGHIVPTRGTLRKHDVSQVERVVESLQAKSLLA